jgi:hypothetical protein
MKNKIAALAIMFLLSGSFASAQNPKKDAPPVKSPQESAAKKPQPNNANHDAAQPKTKKSKEVKHLPAVPCSSEEQEFDKVLRGIYG